MSRKTLLLMLAPLVPLAWAFSLPAVPQPPDIEPPQLREENSGGAEVVAPEAPLDAEALGQLKERLGHKPFDGTVFQATEPLPTLPRGLSPSLLKAAHLLDDAAYVLEQAELFPNAEAIRTQANGLRDQAKQARQAVEPKLEVQSW